MCAEMGKIQVKYKHLNGSLPIAWGVYVRMYIKLIRKSSPEAKNFRLIYRDAASQCKMSAAVFKGVVQIGSRIK